MEFLAAPEPTDIIWENRQFSRNKRLMRTLFAVFVIILLMAASFMLIFSLKKTQSMRTKKYADEDCNEVLKYYEQSESLNLE